MKKLLFFLLFTASLIFAAEDILSVPDEPNMVVIQTADGAQSKEHIKDVWMNYPALRVKLRNAVITRANGEDTLAAKRRISAMQAHGILVPQTALDNMAARIEALRVQRESALLTVKTTNPRRALDKMKELIAAGVPITQATQNAVIAAQPAAVIEVPPVDDGL